MSDTPPSETSPSDTPQADDEQSSTGKRKRSWLLPTLSILVFLGLVSGIAATAMATDRPKTGDCLGSLNTGAFGSMTTVDCSGPDAAYLVVAHTDSGMESQVRASLCDEHPDGEVHIETAVKLPNQVEWAICAVPQ